MSARGPVICTCGHSLGWHTASSVGRCTAQRCVCAAFVDVRALKSSGSKYHNKSATLPERPGERFDSQAESRWARELLLLETAGDIRNLRFHPRWALEVSGVHITSYEADAEWDNVRSGEHVVADLKGAVTAVFRMKRRLMRACYGIEIEVVSAREYGKGR